MRDTIKVRQDNNIERPDVVGLLMEAREEQRKKQKKAEEISTLSVLKHNLTDDEIASQAFAIYVGAFESGSSMCFLAHELAVNPDCQKTLIEEIDKCCSENDEPSYETIMSLPYMDMAVSGEYYDISN